MKIEIETSDLTNLVSALNNALVAYGDVVSSRKLGCEPGLSITSKVAFEQIKEEVCQARYNELLQVYCQLLEIESNLN